jgi:transposase-like protein
MAESHTAPLEGLPVGRRGIKEYRAAEALALIAADRDNEKLVCPSCAAQAVERIPKRSAQYAGRITLHCAACGRSAVYLARGGTFQAPSPSSAPRRR